MSHPGDVRIDLDRDVFLRTLVRELATSLESVIGLEEASGYISLVGQAVGTQIDDMYLKALDTDRLSPEQVAEALVDLKRRIKGDFYVIEQDDTKIVLGNRACPFAEKVLGRESMCMMTSNVFGTIAARNLGYASVELQETIARGDAGCRVVVHLVPGAGPASGREYFADAELPATGPGTGTVPA
ncbi:methanogen output domain 1-containing protein [Streptomyces sp. NPDC006259]|uniref:methanogen output domain 1-containing protein n=1 Tax=Streptomyces sp. NPDC006259 TaxID=3364740 RepID=UPI00367CF92B